MGRIGEEAGAGTMSRVMLGYGFTPDLQITSLFTSFATLICCALPSLLVLSGRGATVVSF